jgi:S1-C subfamily serine protease
VVRVEGYLSPSTPPEGQGGKRRSQEEQGFKPMPLHLPTARRDKPDATGTGVVIDDKGDILTNLHVIRSTDRWVVTFWDGSKSDAQSSMSSRKTIWPSSRPRTRPMT